MPSSLMPRNALKNRAKNGLIVVLLVLLFVSLLLARLLRPHGRTKLQSEFRTAAITSLESPLPNLYQNKRL